MYYVIYMYFKQSSGLLQVQPIHMFKEFHFILKFEKWNDDNANRSIVSILLPLSLPRELSVYNYLHWYFPWRDSDTHRVRLYTSAIAPARFKGSNGSKTHAWIRWNDYPIYHYTRYEIVR